MDRAGRVERLLMVVALVARRGGQVLRRNNGTWLGLKPMSDVAPVVNEPQRGTSRPDAFSYGLWA